MIYARIAGIGSYLPEKVVTNKDLEKMMDTSDEWIRERTGSSGATSQPTTRRPHDGAGSRKTRHGGRRRGPDEIDSDRSWHGDPRQSVSLDGLHRAAAAWSQRLRGVRRACRLQRLLVRLRSCEPLHQDRRRQEGPRNRFRDPVADHELGRPRDRGSVRRRGRSGCPRGLRRTGRPVDPYSCRWRIRGAVCT